MSKSEVKEYVCLGNISVKGESGVKYVKDEFYTAEEVRQAPKDKKHKFALLETINPGAIDGTVPELKALIQRQQIKIQTLEAVVEKYQGSTEQSLLGEIQKLEDEIKRLKKRPTGSKSKSSNKSSSAKKPELPEEPTEPENEVVQPQGGPILTSTGGQTGDEKL